MTATGILVIGFAVSKQSAILWQTDGNVLLTMECDLTRNTVSHAQIFDTHNLMDTPLSISYQSLIYADLRIVSATW